MRDLRERLPNRRAAEVISVPHGPHKFHVVFGAYEDGRLAEVFLSGPKVGSDAQVTAIEAAVAISFALQYGADLEALRTALPRNPDGSPEGVMGAILDAWAALD